MARHTLGSDHARAAMDSFYMLYLFFIHIKGCHVFQKLTDLTLWKLPPDESIRNDDLSQGNGRLAPVFAINSKTVKDEKADKQKSAKTKTH